MKKWVFGLHQRNGLCCSDCQSTTIGPEQKANGSIKTRIEEGEEPDCVHTLKNVTKGQSPW